MLSEPEVAPGCIPDRSSIALEVRSVTAERERIKKVNAGIRKVGPGCVPDRTFFLSAFQSEHTVGPGYIPDAPSIALEVRSVTAEREGIKKINAGIKKVGPECFAEAPFFLSASQSEYTVGPGCFPDRPFIALELHPKKLPLSHNNLSSHAL